MRKVSERYILAGALLVLVAAVVRAAWLSDDAYITLRTIDNFWHGFGLRWNILDRVQVYTHPLWMILVGSAYGVTREAYFTTLAVSGACLAALLALLARRLAPWQAIVAIAALAASRAFIDFSTSGLENPLSHLLLAACCLMVLNGEASVARCRTLAWLAMLCALTRLDLVVIVGPILLVEIWRAGPRRALPAVAPAAMPFIAWHLFTLVYYGSLVPNTAMAKLHTGVPETALVAQGFWYVRESALNDFVTLPLVVAAVAIAAWRGDERSRALAAGVFAYLLYIVWIGGDFMSGRFLTAPFIAGVLLLVQGVRLPRTAMLTAAALLLAGLASPRSPLTFWQTEAPYDWRLAVDDPRNRGIVDERRCYVEFTGLLRNLRGQARVSDHPWAHRGMVWGGRPQVRVDAGVGFLGYHAGPAVHVIDPLALGDAFLAHFPAKIPWRIGHFERALPAGYEATIADCVRRLYPSGAFAPPETSCLAFGEVVNHLEEAHARALFADVEQVTQGPLFSAERWRAIVRVNGW
jgi:arabinofuranosyltransferase